MGTVQTLESLDGVIRSPRLALKPKGGKVKKGPGKKVRSSRTKLVKNDAVNDLGDNIP